MLIDTLIRQSLSGLSVGMGIFLIAVGLVIIFGTIRILNLAHGSTYMIGAFLGWWITTSFSHIPGSFWIAVLVVPLLTALIGYFLEILLFRRLYEKEMIYQLMMTFALVMIFSDVCKIIWGVGFNLLSAPYPLTGAVVVFGTLFPSYNLFLIVIGVVVFLALWLLVNYTQMGRIIRATLYSREMVGSLGINVPVIYTLVFMLGCWLAGLGGVLMAPISAVTLGIDATIIIECFIIAVIGGLGSLPGAFVGSIIFGMVHAFGIMIVPKLAIGFSFIMMAVILVVRPHGLFGRPE
jgi:branched-subunit amino acid ABC-type transport system permease component